MNTRQPPISQMNAITISREYGSGGGEIANRLAAHLHWQLIDHDVVVRVAQEVGVSEAEAEAHDERVQSLLERILSSMQGIDPSLMVVPPTPLMPDEGAYRDALQKIVEAAIGTGHVVIVGRGSQVLLAQRRDVLHARVIAPIESRIEYVMRREGLDQKQAQERIKMKDRDRKLYLQQEYRQDPEDAHHYDIVINTGILDLTSAVDLIVLALEKKAQRLTVTTGELGPGAGQTLYPGQVADFRPPSGLTK